MSSKKSKTTESTNSTIKTKFNRHFSETFKRTKVAEIQQKVITIPQLCELYKVSRTNGAMGGTMKDLYLLCGISSL